MTNTDKFLDLYKELESATRYAYGLGKYDSAVSFLKNHKAYSAHKAEIAFCADIRNLLTHNPKMNGEYAVEPSANVIEFMEWLIDSVKTRVRLRDISIKFNAMSKCTLKSRVSDAISIMKTKGHSHIPIVGNHRVIGIFDEIVLFEVISELGIDNLANNPDLTFNDISRFIHLGDRGTKKYIFAQSSMYLDEIEEIFDKAMENKKRIALVFLTQNGKETEPLQGILTPWGVMSARNSRGFIKDKA